MSARIFISYRTADGVDKATALARDLGLGADAVAITGHVSHQDMLTYYRCADVYVSMSEHEGFGKPLIESMYCGLPVMAYASSAVPDTLGGAGILFHDKNYEALAELFDMLMDDDALRRALDDCGNNVSALARKLGVNRSTIHRRLKRLN